MLVRLTAAAVEPAARAVVPEQIQVEVKIAMEHNPLDAGLERIGRPSDYACPECHGVLLELKDGARTKFRCHTGHAYSIASLLAAIAEGIEDSLWTAVRALEEGQLLMMRMAEHLQSSHSDAQAAQLIDRANEARNQSEAIRKLVMQREPVAEANKS
jgi:two-component system chemotaxis response regulator CheB